MIVTPSSFQLRINSRSSSIFTCWMSLLKFSSVVPVDGKNTTVNIQTLIFTANVWVKKEGWTLGMNLLGWKCRAAQLESCPGCCTGGRVQAAASSWDPSPLHHPHRSPPPGPENTVLGNWIDRTTSYNYSNQKHQFGKEVGWLLSSWRLANSTRLLL